MAEDEVAEEVVVEVEVAVVVVEEEARRMVRWSVRPRPRAVAQCTGWRPPPSTPSPSPRPTAPGRCKAAQQCQPRGWHSLSLRVVWPYSHLAPASLCRSQGPPSAAATAQTDPAPTGAPAPADPPTALDAPDCGSIALRLAARVRGCRPEEGRVGPISSPLTHSPLTRHISTQSWCPIGAPRAPRRYPGGRWCSSSGCPRASGSRSSRSRAKARRGPAPRRPVPSPTQAPPQAPAAAAALGESHAW